MPISTYSNVFQAYITNHPYEYPPENADLVTDGYTVNTGYHILPTMLLRHYLTPKNWFDLHIKASHWKVLSTNTTCFNMIPMTMQLSFQGTQGFTSFNNSIYALGFTDKLYETNWYHWLGVDEGHERDSPNLFYKEGMMPLLNGTQPQRYMPPKFFWKYPAWRSWNDFTWSNDSGLNGQGIWPKEQKYAGLLWDPLNRPDEIIEFRPGKNAITFSWSVHEADKGKGWNMDQLAAWYPWSTDGPFNAKHRPHTIKKTQENDPEIMTSQWQNYDSVDMRCGIIDFTLPNWSNQPIVPMGWFLKEMEKSIIQPFTAQKPDLFFSGVEQNIFKYPPYQHFLKLVPLIDDDNHVINMSAQISIRNSITIEWEPRESAIFAPTYGPFGGKSLYSHRTDNLNFHNSFIRYRTAGVRRTWQNMQQPNQRNYTEQKSKTTAQLHAREDPYVLYTGDPFVPGDGDQYNEGTHGCPDQSGRSGVYRSKTLIPVPIYSDEPPKKKLYPSLNKFK